MEKNLKDIFVDQIVSTLEKNRDSLKKMFTKKNVKHFYVDDLIDISLAKKISDAFPADKKNLMTRKTLRENKTVGIKMSNYDQILSDITYAFHDQKVIDVISSITNMPDMHADNDLYAAGLSMMSKGNFLNPHLDNSHNMERSKYRALNLLFYCTENWNISNGGNLELWHNGPKLNQEIIFAKFNRLVVMKTDLNSWHSVSEVTSDDSRNCISNYYFTNYSPDSSDYAHVTSFRGRPEQFFRDILLRLDSFARSSIRYFYKKQHTKHIKKE